MEGECGSGKYRAFKTMRGLLFENLDWNEIGLPRKLKIYWEGIKVVLDLGRRVQG